ncbi:hypothetical protein L7F22_009093 [Adiantum nelumboides]|nr:hypothetical protein [Adiantum nelumboides]
MASPINVANSFAVPFEEDEGAAGGGKTTWFLDHDYIDGMMEMCKKVNARGEDGRLVPHGPRLRASDQEINDLMKKFIPRQSWSLSIPGRGTRASPPMPILPSRRSRMTATATQKTFTHVPSSIIAEESEEVGVEHLLRDIRDTTTVGTLSTRVSQQLLSLRGLQSRLLEIKTYLEAVVRGRAAGQPPDHLQLAGHLQSPPRPGQDRDGQELQRGAERPAACRIPQLADSERDCAPRPHQQPRRECTRGGGGEQRRGQKGAGEAGSGAEGKEKEKKEVTPRRTRSTRFLTHTNTTVEIFTSVSRQPLGPLLQCSKSMR